MVLDIMYVPQTRELFREGCGRGYTSQKAILRAFA